MGVVWSGTQFVAVGRQGIICTSPDGVVWTTRSSGTQIHLRSVIWAGGQFVAVGGNWQENRDDDNIGPPGSVLLTSPNGITWTRRTVPTGYPIEGILFNGSTFIATGGNGEILTSLDAITWSAHASGFEDTELHSIVWDGTTYVCSTYDHRMLASTDGLSWAAATSVPPTPVRPNDQNDEEGSLNSVVWTGSIFAVVGAHGCLYTSPDGQIWTAQETGTLNKLLGICWNGGTLVAVGLNGTLLSSGSGLTPTPVVEFAETASTTKEGGTAKIYVTLSTPPAAAVTVPFSITYGTASAADITVPVLQLVFNKGETSKFISIPVKNDSLDEPDEDLTLTLLTPTGANLGLPATQTHVLTLLDDDTIPVISPQPLHQLLAIGQPLSLVSGATGSGTVTLQWKKKAVGASTFANISGATAPIYYKAAVALTDAGTYELVATNLAGSTISSTVEVGVYDGAYHGYALSDGTLKTTFTQSASGNGLSYAWVDQNDVAIPPSGTHLTIAGNVLTINNLTAADAQLYKCQVLQAASSLLDNAARFNLDVVTSKATWQTVSLPAGQVGFSYAINISSLASTAATFTASGLPAGLTMDATGSITGIPTAVATNKPVIITATNAKGATPINSTISITAIPSDFTKTFHGLVERDDDVDNGLGARIELTIPTSGICTGKMIVGIVSKPFTGQVSFASNTAASATFTTAPVAGRTITIAADFNLVGSDVVVTGTVGEGPASVAPTSTVNFAAYKASTAFADFKGYYTFGLILPDASQGDATVPQGHGFGQLTVSTTGATTLAGKVGDGSAYTSSSSFVGTGVGTNEGQFIIYSSLYGAKGTLLGVGKLTRDGVSPTWLDNRLETGSVDMTWNKQPDTSTTGARNYPGGWTPITLTMLGSKYTAPATGQRVLNLPDGMGTPNSSLNFYEAGLDDTPPKPDVGIEFKPSATFTLAPHFRSTTFSMTVASGTFKGTFSMIDPMPNSVNLTRVVNYDGLMIRYFDDTTTNWVYAGLGWFPLPQLPSADISPMPLPTTTPILAGHVFLSAP
jgi:hypothetical protein